MPLLQLQLAPILRAAARLIARCSSLGDHPFEPVGPRRVLERHTVVEPRRQQHTLDRRVHQLLEHGPPFEVRAIEEWLAVAFEHIEGDEHERALALLQEPEPGAADIVERADLTVEHRRRRAHREPDRRGDGGEARGEIIVVPAAEGGLAACDASESAVAVPFRLEGPVGSARQQLGGGSEHRCVAPGCHARILAQQEPVARIAVEGSGDECPQPFQPQAVQPHGEPAVVFPLHELVGAAVPDLHRACPVLAGRDLALEVGVVERVILDVDREVAFSPGHRDALGNGPAREHAVSLEPEVVVESPGGVSLDDEAKDRPRRASRKRLRRAGGIALAPVRVEGHSCMIVQGHAE